MSPTASTRKKIESFDDSAIESVQQSGSLRARGETPEEEFFKQLLSDEVEEALDSLPWEFRAVVWLRDIEEMSYREIAEITGCLCARKTPLHPER